jgi:hypothetical protein
MQTEIKRTDSLNNERVDGRFALRHQRNREGFAEMAGKDRRLLPV